MATELKKKAILKKVVKKAAKTAKKASKIDEEGAAHEAGESKEEEAVEDGALKGFQKMAKKK